MINVFWSLNVTSITLKRSYIPTCEAQLDDLEVDANRHYIKTLFSPLPKYDHSQTGSVRAIKAASICHPHQTQSCSRLSRGNLHRKWPEAAGEVPTMLINNLKEKKSLLFSHSQIYVSNRRGWVMINLWISVIMLLKMQSSRWNCVWRSPSLLLFH